jgi:hypothetical protein
MQVSTWRADVVLYACSVHVVAPSGIVVWATNRSRVISAALQPFGIPFGTHCSAELVHSNSCLVF